MTTQAVPALDGAGERPRRSFCIEGVTAGHGSAEVLHDVSLRVAPHGVVALLGPNGAGKTTLLSVAAGLLRPWTGSVRLGDRDLTGVRPDQRARSGLCFIPEGRGVFTRLTVLENLRLQAQKGDRGDAVERAVQAFPVLGRRLGQLAGTLSGGEQQMLALSRAYVTDPEVVFLDEVSLGLAPLLVDEIYEFLAQLVAAGASLVLVEQYVDRALAIADDVYVIAGGRIRFNGPPSELDDDELQRRYLGAELDEGR